MKIVKITIALFIILFIFQILTGIFLFYEKYGFTVSSISNHILGNPDKFINPKTVLGLIEIVMPHFFAIFLVIFIISHLLYFFKIKIYHFILSGITFLAGFLDIISNFLILKISSSFAYLKIFSFLTFEFGIFLMIFILFFNIISKLNH